MQVNAYDLFMLYSSILVGILCLMLLIYSDDGGVETFSDYAIIFTHLFILPTVYLCLKTPWLYTLLILTSLFSIMYHIAKIVMEEYESYELADMASQGVLIWLTMLLFIFEDMPPLGIAVLFIVAVVISAFGDIKVTVVDVDTITCSIPMLIVVFYIIHKMLIAGCSLNSDFFQTKRKYVHVFLSLAYFFIAYVLFVVASNYEGTKYSLIHATWHVCAYVALYFIFSSRKNQDTYQIDEVRLRRTDFALY